MKTLKSLEKQTRKNESIVRIFKTKKETALGVDINSDELCRTFTDNEEAISFLKNLAFKNRGIISQEENKFNVTTENNFYSALLIK